MQAVTERAAIKFKVLVPEILGNSRVPKYVTPRHWAMTEAFLEGYTIAQITRFFRRDHKTVSDAIDAMLERRGMPRTKRKRSACTRGKYGL
jgi:chromosomal replication initiation ATPase DnaA